MFQLVGNPNNIDPDFKDVKSMLRMQIGISRRSKDVKESTTFRAIRVLQVSFY